MTQESALLLEESAARECGAINTARELKRATTRGALVSICGQTANFALRTGSMIVMARLLTPKDFGLVGMVASVTGFLGLFRDLGLSMATVQRVSITNAQTSTLFWVNIVAGAVLATLCALLSPALVAFYGEPRLFWISMVSGTSFIVNGAGAQHRAILQRGMHFLEMTIVDTVSLVLSLAMGIASALAGEGCWALVVATVSQQVFGTVGVWFATRWVPGWPQRRTGVRSMLKYGGTVTVNSVISYLTNNADKVLLGRFWGPEALGIYGRAYQLINIPSDNLNATLGLVAFPAWSRVQNDPSRLRSHFLRGYGLFLSLVLPITLACGMFAEDIVRVFLGPQWSGAAPIFRLMVPTVLVFALINPLGWLMLSLGYATRSLRIASLVAPVLLLGYAIGLRQGPHGVAAGFSISMVLLAIPVIVWCKYGTLISNSDVLKVIAVPLISAVGGALIVWGLGGWLRQVQPAFLRLVMESIVLFSVHLVILLLVLKQKSVYLDLLRCSGLWPLGFVSAHRGEKSSR